MKLRTEAIFEKRFGFDPKPSYNAGLIAAFHDWPAGGGNLNYPCVYREGLASMIKEVEERQIGHSKCACPTSKSSTSTRPAHRDAGIVRYAKRYAELAREMAASEKDETRKAELLSLAETCEWVPEHPARNLREAIQCHFFCHIIAELEQIGCGYSQAYLGQNLEPFFKPTKPPG